MRDLFAAAGWLALVILTVVLMRHDARRGDAAPGDARDSVARPALAVHLLLAIATGMTLLAGLSQREFWPFANWKLMPDQAPREARLQALRCIDSSGARLPIDHRAWRPLSEEELLSWLQGPYAQLAPARQAEARRALLEMTEAARRRTRAGNDPGASPSVLGSLAAPTHLLHPDRWRRADDAPARPCRALRYEALRWDTDPAGPGFAAAHDSILWQEPAP